MYQKGRRRGPMGPAAFLFVLMLFGGGILADGAFAFHVEGPQTHLHSVRPGDTVHSSFVLHNDRDEPVWVHIYLADYAYDANEGWRFPPPGSLSRSSAPWIDWTDVEFVLQPGERRTVAYRMDVPEDDGLRGTYWTSFMVERKTPMNTVPADISDRRGTVALGQRVRHQLAVLAEVAGPVDKHVAFQDPALVTTPDGALLLHVVVENTGDGRIEPDAWIELYDGDGRSLGRVEGARRRLLPGTSVIQQFALPELPPADYVAMLFLDDGDGDVFATRLLLRLTPPDESMEPAGDRG